MQSALFFDMVLTVFLSLALVGAAFATLLLLPWSDADRAGTLRAAGSVARWVGAAADRASAPFHALPVGR